MLYYEKLRKIVECTCEALPQILFQVYILTAANEVLKIHPPILVFSMLSSLLVLYLRVTEITRGAHYRQITVKEHVIQVHHNTGITNTTCTPSQHTHLLVIHAPSHAHMAL